MCGASDVEGNEEYLDTCHINCDKIATSRAALRTWERGPRANRMARVLEDAGCFEAHHCQSLYTVRYCETCSNCMWQRLQCGQKHSVLPPLPSALVPSSAAPTQSRINHDSQFFKEAQHDTTMQFIENAASCDDDSAATVWTAQEEQKLRRRIDYAIMPLAILMYACSLLDHANISNARSYGLDNATGMGTMERELGMVPGNYNNIASLYYVPYCLMEPLANFFLIKFKPNWWLSRIMISWGIVATLMSAVSDYGGLLACRMVLGAAEAGFFPGLMFAFTYWYTPDEVSNRIAVISMASGVISTIGAFIAAGVYLMDGSGGVSAWRWLLFLEGVPSVILGMMVPFLYPPEPATADWLSPRERMVAMERLKKADPAKVGGADQSLRLRDALPVYTDWRTWVHVFTTMMSILPVFAMKFFLPSILAFNGYQGALTQIMTIPITIWNPLCIGLGAWIAQKIGNRSIPHIVANLVGGIGFVCLAYVRQPTVQYVLLFVTGINAPAAILNFGWYNSNQRSHTGRAGALGLVNGVGNLAGVIGPQLYRDGPIYARGHWMLGMILFASAFCVTCLSFSYIMDNRAQAERNRTKESQGQEVAPEDKVMYKL
ncbi:hypothetical protein SeLEV6574_g05685 [Synchytrium endobioticum]|uniref:Major facilitator superfamily (MFS) profile domain-containing protein n=1 Tax=Synchytrium endobioticum TaxID=286115 RepID=A0A507CT78_9FUNG|nr:hypothetical protein SeLEV6574_g05685 [Synchytrium endobioticum]